ncbi:hypothetical protein BGZ60DRAFT_532767 [Tricladium varicosporioides]|nr:hypothetical protein BGZ60DRAFT_532767 [Hymenoscyphus varicosporioides]
MERLVDVFREIGRLSDSSATGVTIRTTSWMAWIEAFTEWCLGYAPRIFIDDGRDIRDIHNPPGSLVSLTILPKAPTDWFSFEVPVQYGLGVEDPRPLVVVKDGGAAFKGMPGLRAYGQWLLRSRRFDQGLANLAFKEVIPTVLYQTLSCLRFSNHSQMPDLRPHPFPGREWQSVFTEKFLESLRKGCVCSKCKITGDSTKESFSSCKFDLFYLNLSVIVTDILALSLLNYPEGLLVRPSIPQHSPRCDALPRQFMQILMTVESKVSSIHHLLGHALALAGHVINQQAINEEWTMSCYMGQAVWPAILDTKVIEKHGFLALNWARGELKYQGASYNEVKGLGNFNGQWSVVQQPDPHPVLRPLNLFPQVKMAFKVTIGNRELSVGLGLDGMDAFSSYTISPVQVLINLSQALILEACPHDPGAELSKPDRFCDYMKYPIFDIAPEELQMNQGVQRTRVIGVDNHESLQIFSCGIIQLQLIVRKHACLSCCLSVCRKTGCRVLIL